MCGRFVQKNLEDNLREFVDLKSIFVELVDNYNVSPGQVVPLLTMDSSQKHEIRGLKWGFLPHWFNRSGAKQGNTMRPQINARAEGIDAKPFFRDSFKHKRCLIPANGFFEWRDKQPYYIHPENGELLYFAGIWDHVESESSSTQQTFAIITTAANDRVRTLHDRMPAIISKSSMDIWLHGPCKEASGLLKPSALALQFYPVSKQVNGTTLNGAELTIPLENSGDSNI